MVHCCGFLTLAAFSFFRKFGFLVRTGFVRCFHTDCFVSFRQRFVHPFIFGGCQRGGFRKQFSCRNGLDDRNRRFCHCFHRQCLGDFHF